MSNKREATYGRNLAVVHLAILYDAICHECDWESDGNPYAIELDAEHAAEAHRCKK